MLFALCSTMNRQPMQSGNAHVLAQHRPGPRRPESAPVEYVQRQAPRKPESTPEELAQEGQRQRRRPESAPEELEHESVEGPKGPKGPKGPAPMDDYVEAPIVDDGEVPMDDDVEAPIIDDGEASEELAQEGQPPRRRGPAQEGQHPRRRGPAPEELAQEEQAPEVQADQEPAPEVFAPYWTETKSENFLAKPKMVTVNKDGKPVPEFLQTGDQSQFHKAYFASNETWSKTTDTRSPKSEEYQENQETVAPHKDEAPTFSHTKSITEQTGKKMVWVDDKGVPMTYHHETKSKEALDRENIHAHEVEMWMARTYSVIDS